MSVPLKRLITSAMKVFIFKKSLRLMLPEPSMRSTKSEERLGHSGGGGGGGHGDVPMVSLARMSPMRPSVGDPHTSLGSWDELELMQVGVEVDAEAIEVDVLPAGLGRGGATCLGWGWVGTPQNQQSRGWGGGIPGVPPEVVTSWGATSLMSPQKDQTWGCNLLDATPERPNLGAISTTSPQTG